MMYVPTSKDYEWHRRNAKKHNEEVDKELAKCCAAFFKPVKTTQEQKKAVIELRFGNFK